MMRRRPVLLPVSGGLALLAFVLCAPAAFGYPMYDDGAGNGCVQCHDEFQNGNQPLHTQHRNLVTTCNVCHPSGPGTTPVRTYTSGVGGGYGCAGCHGQLYGEISPNSGQAKATAYGLRQHHVNNGETTCGVAGGCHVPGALGHDNPFPPLFGENVAPPYYDPIFTSLTDPCSSAEEDMPFDVGETLGLDNDGDGNRDYPADSDCSPATTTTTTSTTTSTTLPFTCAAAPAGGCIAPTKGALLVNDKVPGKEKVKVSLAQLLPLVTPSQFGDPVTGSTRYNVCIYDATNQLVGEYNVARAGDTCGTKPCWAAVSTKGYKYADKLLAADGVLKILLFGGDAGKGKVKVNAKNNAATLPLGTAAALAAQSSATVQVVAEGASCVGVNLTTVKVADGVVFSAAAP